MTETIEHEIFSRGLNAPRVTPNDIEKNIIREHYINVGEVLSKTYGKNLSSASAVYRLTICILELRNGFTVSGESACVSPENFDEAIGRKIARMNAVEKIWPLMGYALQDEIYNKSI